MPAAAYNAAGEHAVVCRRKVLPCAIALRWVSGVYDKEAMQASPERRARQDTEGWTSPHTAPIVHSRSSQRPRPLWSSWKTLLDTVGIRRCLHVLHELNNSDLVEDSDVVTDHCNQSSLPWGHRWLLWWSSEPSRW